MKLLKQNLEHCNLCCDKCNEWKTSYRTPCGGYHVQCINLVKGYSMFQQKCSCSPHFGQYEVTYLKFRTPYSQFQQECQCRKQNRKSRKWLNFFGL